MSLTKRQKKILQKFFNRYSIDDFYDEVSPSLRDLEYIEVEELYDLFDEDCEEEEEYNDSDSFFEGDRFDEDDPF